LQGVLLFSLALDRRDSPPYLLSLDGGDSPPYLLSLDGRG